MYQSRKISGFGSETGVLLPRYIRAGLLLSPFLLLLCYYLLSWESLHIFTQIVGGISLLTVPGYLVLYILGLDPLAADASGYRWSLVLPLSISVNVILGMLLVLTPVGLSFVSLWTGLSILTIVCILFSIIKDRKN